MLPPRSGSISARLETGRHQMRVAFGREACATALLAVLFTIQLLGPAGSEGLSTAPDGDGRSSSAQCGGSDDGCRRIRGHIPAAPVSGGVETIGGRPTGPGTPPPFLTGLGAAGQAAADAVNRGFFFLQASHD